MNIKKSVIGILAAPYIGKKIKTTIFLNTSILKILKKNNIDYFVIPYNIPNSDLKNIINNIDGLIIPGSQIGNYYNTIEFRKHFLYQKYLVKLAKKINKFERIFPILTICHGYQNLLLIENNLSPLKNDLNKFFIKLDAFNAYKTHPKFTKNGTKFRQLYNKSRKILHNATIGISPNKLNTTKKIHLIATSKDKNGKEFVNIIKYKNLPFYGFQAHPEINNPELLIPYLNDVKKSFQTRNLSKNTYKIKPIVKGKKVLCSKYGLAKKTSKRKCFFYKI